MASKWYNSGVSGEEENTSSPNITRVEVQTPKKGGFATFAWGVLAIFGVKAAAQFVESAADFRKAGNPDIILGEGEEDADE